MNPANAFFYLLAIALTGGVACKKVDATLAGSWNLTNVKCTEKTNYQYQDAGHNVIINTANYYTSINNSGALVFHDGNMVDALNLAYASPDTNTLYYSAFPNGVSAGATCAF